MLGKAKAGHSPAPPVATTGLVVAAFQTSLNNLLLAATKHQTMSPLRDAIQSTRVKGFSVEDIFHTFVLACDMLHGRRQYLSLLMQTLSDLGTMASLRMLPMSGSVVHIISHLVLKLLGQGHGGSLNMASCSLRGTVVCGRSSFNTPSFSFLDKTLEADTETHEGSVSPSANETSGELMPPNDELEMRILQTLMKYLSACALGNAALADIMSILFNMYLQATPGSMVEATCAAAVEERTNLFLRSLRSGNDADHEEDGASLTARMQSVAYVKDICAICCALEPRWLKLNAQRNNSSPLAAADAGMTSASPSQRRLRILLLQTLVAHFVESDPIRSAKEANIFFTQFLNEDIVLLVLGQVSILPSSHYQQEGKLKKEEEHQQPQPEATEALVNFISSLEERQDEEEFYLTEKLCVVVISKALPVMRHAIPSLLRHHVTLVKLCRETNGDEAGNAQRIAVVFTLWQKAIADHELLQQLLFHLTPTSSDFFIIEKTPHVQKKLQREASFNNTAHSLLDSLSDAEWLPKDDTKTPNLFADLVTATAELFIDVMTASKGTLDLDCAVFSDEKNTTRDSGGGGGGGVGIGSPWDVISTALSRSLPFSPTPKLAPQVKEQAKDSVSVNLVNPGMTGNGGERHLATGQAGDALAFLTMFTQSFARVVEATLPGKRNSDDGTAVGYTREEAASLFASLHPHFLRSFTLAMQHLQGDDVIHVILKATTHLVQASCSLGLSAQRDEYLKIFLARLQMDQEPFHVKKK